MPSTRSSQTLGIAANRLIGQVKHPALQAAGSEGKAQSGATVTANFLPEEVAELNCAIDRAVRASNGTTFHGS